MAKRWATCLLVGSALGTSWLPSIVKKYDSHTPLRARQSSSSCGPSTYNSTTGYQFNVHCNTDQPGWNLVSVTWADPSENITSIQDCMDLCSSQRPLCYGIAYHSDIQECWFKNDTFTYDTSETVYSNVTHLAVPASSGQLNEYPTKCGYTNLTTTEVNGENFTIHCQQDMVGGDETNANGNLLEQGFHAPSFSNCLYQCSVAIPLCLGVAYNPDMLNGWANCYPKSSLSPFSSTGKNINGGIIVHSAVAKLPSIPYDCTNNAIVADSNNTGYTTTCDQDVPGNDIAPHHAQSVQACIDSCSQYTGSDGPCNTIVFDTNMVNGFQNCYLKSRAGASVDGKQGFVIAEKGNAVASSTTSSGAGSTGTSSGGSSSGGGPTSSGISGGAIAGIVIGALAGVALIAALVWFLLRRRRRNLDQSHPAPFAPAGGEASQRHHSHTNSGYGQIDHKVMPSNALQQDTVSEAGWQEGQHVPGMVAKPYPGGPGQGHGEAYEMQSQDRMELPAAQVERAELPASEGRQPTPK